MKKFFAAVVSVAALSGSLFADGVEYKFEIGRKAVLLNGSAKRKMLWK